MIVHNIEHKSTSSPRTTLLRDALDTVVQATHFCSTAPHAHTYTRRGLWSTRTLRDRRCAGRACPAVLYPSPARHVIVPCRCGLCGTPSLGRAATCALAVVLSSAIVWCCASGGVKRRIVLGILCRALPECSTRPSIGNLLVLEAIVTLCWRGVFRRTTLQCRSP